MPAKINSGWIYKDRITIKDHGENIEAFYSL